MMISIIYHHDGGTCGGDVRVGIDNDDDDDATLCSPE
jgi:hypothetical protein